MKLEIYSSVLDYINTNFPAPFYAKTDKYEVGTLLFTSNPYIRTNATIIEEVEEGNTYKILTDIGNVLNQDVVTLAANYFKPEAKRVSVLEESMESFSLPIFSFAN